MSVPPFNAWLLPLLQRTADGATHTVNQLADRLADDLGLTPDDRAVALTSGQPTYSGP